MKQIFYALLMGVALVSCDKREDLFYKTNQAIVSTMNLQNSHSGYSATINGNAIQDTVKLGFDYRFDILTSDENESIRIEFEGDGTMLMDGGVLTSGNYLNGNHEFVWGVTTPGEYSFKVKLIDVYDVETVYNFSIHVFENRLPYTWWEVIDDNSLGPLHKIIRVHGGDGDQIYGGEITYCRIQIDNNIDDYPAATWNGLQDYHYIFPAPGNYTISVKAMDSNGEWGNEIILNNYPIN